MPLLPKVIEDIIFDYQFQMEHKEKFQATIKAINEINYTTGVYNNGEIYLTTRELPSESYMSSNHVEYYHQIKNRLMIEAHYCFRGDSVIHCKSIHTTANGFVKVENQGIAYD